MDHIKVLKRAFEITWNYKTLWIFGIVLALTVASGSSSPGNPSSSTQPDAEYRMDTFEDLEILPELSRQTINTIIAIAVAVGLGCVCLVIFLTIARLIARYVAEVSLIRLVDDYEETGEKRSFREGVRMGWSRAAFSLFLIDLVLFLGRLVIIIPMMLTLIAVIGLSVLLLLYVSTAIGVVGIVIGVGLLFLFILTGFILGLILKLLKPFFQRACVLEKAGPIISLRQGFTFVVQHLVWDLALMWLLVIGLSISWIVLMIFVGLGLLLIAISLAGLPVLVIGGLGSLIFGGYVPWIIGGVVALPIFLLVIIIPSLFLRGLEMTFRSTIWTLTYRELRILEELSEEAEIEAEEVTDLGLEPTA